MNMTVWVVEVIRGVAKGVDLELGEQVLWKFLEEPVDDQGALYRALGVQDEDDFGVPWVIKLLLNLRVPDPDLIVDEFSRDSQAPLLRWFGGCLTSVVAKPKLRCTKHSTTSKMIPDL